MDTTGKPDLPCSVAGKPQSVDGALGNTPPKSFRLSLTLRTREASPGMQREVDSRKGKTLAEIPMP